MVVNHNPICSCTAGYTGDPFVRCLKAERKISFLATDIFDISLFYMNLEDLFVTIY